VNVAERESEHESTHGGRKIVGETGTHGVVCDMEEWSLPAAIKVCFCPMCSVIHFAKCAMNALIGNLRWEVMEEALCDPFVLPAESSYGWRTSQFLECDMWDGAMQLLSKNGRLDVQSNTNPSV
jgi:hypothetical protein